MRQHNRQKYGGVLCLRIHPVALKDSPSNRNLFLLRHPLRLPGMHTPVTFRRSSLLASASLVLGIVSIVGAIPLSFVTIVVALVGLILGIIALRKVSKGTGGGKGMAIGGVVTSAIGFILSAVVLIFVIITLMMVQDCKNTGVQNSDGSVTCSINGQQMTVRTDGTTSIR